MKLNDKTILMFENNLSITKELLTSCKKEISIRVSAFEKIKKHVEIESELGNIKVLHYEKTILIYKYALDGNIEKANQILEEANLLHNKISLLVDQATAFQRSAYIKNKELISTIENSKKIANGLNHSLEYFMRKNQENIAKKTGEPVAYTVDAIHVDKDGNITESKKSIESVIESLADEC